MRLVTKAACEVPSVTQYNIRKPGKRRFEPVIRQLVARSNYKYPQTMGCSSSGTLSERAKISRLDVNI